MDVEKDKSLWKLAKKRVAFRRHLVTYLLVNILVWGIWYFTASHEPFMAGLPWPAWLTLGWGIIVAFNYHDAYYGSQDDAVEREYEKLSRNKPL